MLLEQACPLGRGLHVRGERPGDFCWCAGEEHDQLAADVEAGEVIVVCLRNREAVACEDEIGFECCGRVHARAEDGVLAERQGRAVAVTNQYERTTRLRRSCGM